MPHTLSESNRKKRERERLMIKRQRKKSVKTTTPRGQFRSEYSRRTTVNTSHTTESHKHNENKRYNNNKKKGKYKIGKTRDKNKTFKY
jgi:hypothetical protein